MNILAIESSSNYGSIAVLENTNLLFERFFSSQEFKTEQLTNYIKDTLKSLSIPLNNIGCFAVSLGPGSYTALRIGLTTIRTMAQVLNKPLIGISTLDIIAFQALPLEGTLMVLNKARKDIINIALFGLNKNNIIRLTDDFTVDNTTLINNLLRVRGKLFLSGDLSQDILSKIKSKNNNTYIDIIPELLHVPKASTLGFMASNKLIDNNIPKSLELKINYAFTPHIIISNKNDSNKNTKTKRP